MTKIGVALFAFALLGCGKDSSSTESSTAAASPDDYKGSPECDEALGKWMEVARAAGREQLEQRLGSATAEAKERAERGLERGEKNMIKVKVALSKRCTEDKWPGEVLDCMKAITDRKEIFACLNKLPPEQQEKAKADANAARMGGRRPGMGGGPNGMGGGPGMPPPMGSAHSDMGTLRGANPPGGPFIAPTPPALVGSAHGGSATVPAATGSAAKPAAGSAAGSGK
jgi:hypothetical protein